MEYFNTFGGSPVACAIGIAVLDVIKDEKLQENALVVGDFFLSELKKLKDKFDCMGDVRGSGLFLGIELVRNGLEPDADLASFVALRMMESGCFILSIFHFILVQ